MGSGKTSAAIAYMNEHKDRKFIYVTPYLSEVRRICDTCGFEQPEGESGTKLADLKLMLRDGKNVSTTHALVSFMDDEAIDIVRKHQYSIIIDEELQVIERVNLTKEDVDAIKKLYVTIDKETMRVSWTDREYKGKFSICKSKAEEGLLYYIDGALIIIMNPAILRAFNEVIVMTYMFEGQYQRQYFDFFGFSYELWGVDSSNGFRFTDKPVPAQREDYSSLINIINSDRLNDIGKQRTALSKTWYVRRGKSHPDIKKLRGHMDYVFRCRGKEVPAARQLWTTYKVAEEKLYGPNNRYKNSFLHMNARATNAYRNCDTIAYMLNIFPDPNIRKFFCTRGVRIDDNELALSDMLQFIWRSAIRDGKPITIYIPSKRMRNLLINWIESVNVKNDN